MCNDFLDLYDKIYTLKEKATFLISAIASQEYFLGNGRFFLENIDDEFNNILKSIENIKNKNS